MVSTPSTRGETEIPGGGPDPADDRDGPRVDLWLSALMVALAIVGVGVTQVQNAGGRLYWLFLTVVYAVISIGRSWSRAKSDGRPRWTMIRAQVLHWVATLVAINIVLVFEASDVTDRGSASDFSLLLLALSSFLAGVHFNWTYMVLGALLAVIAVALGYLDQLSVFALAVPIAVVALWIFFKRKHGPAS